MRRFIIKTAGALALTLLGSAAALAQPYGPPGYGPPPGPPGYGPPPGPGYGPPPGPGYGPPGWRWHRGDFYRGHRHLVDWRYYNLRPPPYGYVWIVDRGRFLLIGVDSGEILEVR